MVIIGDTIRSVTELPAMYICLCNAVTDRDIRAAVESGACSLDCLQERLYVSTCCGQCAETAQACLEHALSEIDTPAAA